MFDHVTLVTSHVFVSLNSMSESESESKSEKEEDGEV